MSERLMKYTDDEGWTIIAYGKRSLSIQRDGIEILHIGFRKKIDMKDEDLPEELKCWKERYKMIMEDVDDKED